MCTVCGCGTAVIAEGPSPAHGHDHLHTHPHDHSHTPASDHHHHEHAQDTIDFGAGLAGVDVPGLSQKRTIRIERDILSKNNAFADANRTRLRAAGIFALNFVSSPGSGKTSLLVRTITDLKDRWQIGVIEGDQQTSRDADRIRATGASAVQVNTGKGCHLDAHMVGHALDQLPLGPGGVLFIESVGNLVCPAAFDLGEAHKVVVLSVTEGEDKPLKYPDMFRAASLLLLNKCDLLPHLTFDVAFAIECAHRVNPGLAVIQMSATSGTGMPEWLEWIERHRPAVALAQGAG